MSLRQPTLASPIASEEELIVQACDAARELEEIGRYEEARNLLSSYWSRIGERPSVEHLGERAKNELLLRAGALTGWLGSARQLEDSPEIAKNLIHESIDGFTRIKEDSGRLEALIALAVCYWREGELDNARTLLLDVTTNSQANQKIRSNALLNLAMVERKAGHIRESLEYLKQVEAFIGAGSNLAYKGRLHNARANCYFLLSESERKSEFIDKAILDWTSAAYYYELASHTPYQASIENNLGFALMQTGQFRKAHEHLDTSRRLYASIKDIGRVAQVDDTRARLFIQEGKYKEAVRISRASVKVLEAGGEKSALVESLITHGTALARSGESGEAKAVLTRACFIAETSGDIHSAGLALVVLLEESLSVDSNASRIYAKADDLLSSTDDMALIRRLRSCARSIMRQLEGDKKEEDVDLYDGFSLKEATWSFQQKYVIKAMQKCSGKIKPAAKLLGVSRQALQQMLGKRFKNVRFLQSTTAQQQSIMRDMADAESDILIAPDESLSSLGIHTEDVLVIFPQDSFSDGEPIVAKIGSGTYIGYYRFDGENVFLDGDFDDPLKIAGNQSKIVGRVIGYIPFTEKHKRDCTIRPV